MVKTNGEGFCMLELSISSLFNNILNVLVYQLLPALLLLAFCITIHEFGHFLIAKLFHIPVEKFSIGYGPPLFRKKIGETDFRIAYFPLGGYVKMAGEEEGEILKTEAKADNESQEGKGYSEPGFYEAPIYKRTLIVFAGPLFNIISAIIVLIITFSIFGLSVDPYTKIKVEEDSYAYRAGFVDGDSVISVNNSPIYNWDKFIEVLSQNREKEVSITIVRNGTEISKNVTVNLDSLGITNLVPPVLGTIKRGGPAHKAGLKMGDRILKINRSEVQTWYELVDIVRKTDEASLLFEWEHEGEIKTADITPILRYDPVWQDTIRQIGVLKPHTRIYLPPLEMLVLAVDRTAGMTWMTLNIFYQLIIGKISKKAVGGPIAIIRLTTESAQWGLEFLLALLAIISINLGIINLFPIPALDGGHIVIATIEAVRRKRFSRKTRIMIQQIGYAIIFLIIIFVTFNDITR